MKPRCLDAESCVIGRSFVVPGWSTAKFLVILPCSHPCYISITRKNEQPLSTPCCLPTYLLLPSVSMALTGSNRGWYTILHRPATCFPKPGLSHLYTANTCFKLVQQSWVISSETVDPTVPKYLLSGSSWGKKMPASDIYFEPKFLIVGKM